MITMMPMADKGAFGMKLGAMAPVMSLMMHRVLGVILGVLFGWMIWSGSAESTPINEEKS